MLRNIQKISVLLAASAFCLALPTSALADSTDRDFEEPSDQSDSSDISNSSAIQSSVKCENLATVAYQGDAKAEIISWKSNEFGGYFTGYFTLEERCKLVSERFNRAIQANNGSFQGLELTRGPVNYRMAICVLKPGETDCTSSNMLLILKRSNERYADRFLEQLQQIYRRGIVLDNGDPTVDVNKWVQQKLRTGKSSSTPSVHPNSRPNGPNGGFR